MTKEERIKLINHLKYSRSIGADYLITDDDVDEIIKALEQEPCEDAVSRQAAQAKIKSICDEYRLSYEDGERKPATGGSAYALGHALDDLPSITKQENYVNIPYLMHKEMDVPISECQKAYDVAIDYLRKQGKVKG